MRSVSGLMRHSSAFPCDSMRIEMDKEFVIIILRQTSRKVRGK